MSKYDNSMVTVLFGNGEVFKIPYSEDLMPQLLEIHSGSNPCGECQNFTNCKKIWDTKKKNIEEYSFIKKGYMIRREDGDLLAFAIDECDDYIKDLPKQKLSVPELRKLRRNLKDAFEDAYHVVVNPDKPVGTEAFVKTDKRRKKK